MSKRKGVSINLLLSKVNFYKVPLSSLKNLIVVKKEDVYSGWVVKITVT